MGCVFLHFFRVFFGWYSAFLKNAASKPTMIRTNFLKIPFVFSFFCFPQTDFEPYSYHPLKFSITLHLLRSEAVSVALHLQLKTLQLSSLCLCSFSAARVLAQLSQSPTSGSISLLALILAEILVF